MPSTEVLFPTCMRATSDMEEPRREKLRTDMDEPRLAKLRSDKPLPSCTKSSTFAQFVVTWLISDLPSY